MDTRYAKGRMQLEGNWASLRRQLDEISRNDAQAETEVAVGNKAGCTGLGLIFLGIFTSAFIVGIPILIYGLFKATTGFRQSSVASKYDLENMRYQLPTQLLDGLAVDIDPDRPISLMIDFTASQSPQFVQKTEQKKFLFFNSGPKVTHFSHPWLELSTTTVDGHRIKVSLTRQGTFRSETKTKRSGSKTKYRSKTRLRYCDVISSVVRPPAGQQWSAGSLDMPNRPGLRAFQGRVNQQGVAVKAVGPIHSVVSYRGTRKSGRELDALDILGVLISCFRGLSSGPKEITSV